MTPIEKAETALNARIDRLQANLREAESETTRSFLFQSLVACMGIGEALKNYIRTIGEYAKERYTALKPAQESLTAHHTELLQSGKGLLEQLKANPADRALRKEIERTQTAMEAIQKNLRRGANALQRDVAPSMGLIDPLSLSLRRFAEADQFDALQRVLKQLIEHAHDLYAAQPTLPAKGIIDAAAWEKTAASEIVQATDFHEAYARAGYQAMLVLEVMTMAVSPTPPETAGEAIKRAGESVVARIKAITARFTPGES